MWLKNKEFVNIFLFYFWIVVKLALYLLVDYLDFVQKWQMLNASDSMNLPI